MVGLGVVRLWILFSRVANYPQFYTLLFIVSPLPVLIHGHEPQKIQPFACLHARQLGGLARMAGLAKMCTFKRK
jgi:hypothetical protein